MNLVFIGYRGCGKTTLGRKLADKLWMDFVDTDEKIVARAGQSIRSIFETQGEVAFRDLESQVIAQVASLDGQVIAVGGGALLRNENVAVLKTHGRLIWLQADAEVLWERIARDAGSFQMRPNLTASGGLEEVRQVLQEREAIYRAAADITLDVTRMSIDHAIYYLSQQV